MVVATSAAGKAPGDVSGRKNVFQTNLKWEIELEVAGDGGGDAGYGMGVNWWVDTQSVAPPGFDTGFLFFWNKNKAKKLH